MIDNEDEFWARLLDEVGPDGAELARAERDLQATATLCDAAEETNADGAVFVPDAAWIERSVARVTSADADARDGTGTGSLPPAWFLTRRRRRLATSMLAILVLPLAAWGVVKLWPSRQNSDETMTFVEAAGIAVQTADNEAARESAMARLDAGIAVVVRGLRDVMADEAAAEGLRADAALLMAGLHQLALVGDGGQLAAIELDCLGLSATALDEKAAAQQRSKALRQLAAFGTAALRALHGVNGSAALNGLRDAYLARIVRDTAP